MKNINLSAQAEIPQVAVAAPGQFSPEQETALKLAKELLKESQKFGEKYKAFIDYCRAKLLPKDITAVLLAAGFPNSTASQLKLVACLPPEDYRPYAKGQISFRATVQKARIEKKKKTGHQRRANFAPFLKAGTKFLQSAKDSFAACVARPLEFKEGGMGHYVIGLNGHKGFEQFTVEDKILIEVTISEIPKK